MILAVSMAPSDCLCSPGQQRQDLCSATIKDDMSEEDTLGKGLEF